MTGPGSSRSRRLPLTSLVLSRQHRAHERAYRLEVGRERLALPDEGNLLAHEVVGALGPASEPRWPPQVDGLRRDDELDGDDPLAELDHRREVPRGERRHR